MTDISMGEKMKIQRREVAESIPEEVHRKAELVMRKLLETPPVTQTQIAESRKREDARKHK